MDWRVAICMGWWVLPGIFELGVWDRSVGTGWQQVADQWQPPIPIRLGDFHSSVFRLAIFVIGRGLGFVWQKMELAGVCGAGSGLFG